MKQQVGCNIHNRFDIEVIRDGKVIQRAKAENIVLDRMYTRLCNYSTYFVNICFGQGTGTLDPTRTTLFSSLGYKAASTEETIKAFPVSKWTRKITLNPEEYVGKTITEVGISDTTNAINTHALITDAEGNPLSITKTDIDVVVIYATVFIELQNKDTNVYFNRLPTGNKLLNYLCGSSWSEPTLQLGRCPVLNQGNANDFIMSKDLTKTTNGRTITYTTRIGTDQANTRISEISLESVFKVLLPAVGVWNEFQLIDVPLGTGDGVTNTFIIPHQDIYDVIIKINDVSIPDTNYSLLHTGYEESQPILPICSILDYSEPPELSIFGPEIFDGVLGNGPIPLGTTKTWTIKVDPNKVVGKTVYARGAAAYGNRLLLAASLDGGTTWSSYLIDVTSKDNNVERTHTFTQPYTHLRITLGTTNAYTVPAVQLHLINTDEPQIVFNDPIAEGDVITADYKVPYIPKTADYVLDVTMEINFGEGV
jgi:hypothetical protein